MNNMLQTIIPKSDQLNADDLIGGQSITIEITDVSIVMADQPVSISYKNDGGKPYKPGKSMRRVIVNAWGADTKLYIGRFLTLYRDDKVKFGGAEVGGLRISHMSNIAQPITMALTATRASRKPFTVQPLAEQQKAEEKPDAALEMVKTNLEKAAEAGVASLQKAWEGLDPKYKKTLEKFKDGLKEVAKQADATPLPI